MSIKWEQLVAQGRAKAHGVPWSDEENAALAAGIPAEYVREGILTVEELQAAKEEEVKEEEKTGKKPLKRQSKDELMEQAKEVNPQVTNEAPKEALIKEIEAAAKKPKKKKKK